MTPVCFVITPSGFLLDERVFMSLGILRVAAVLEAHGMAVEVLDLSGIENGEEVVRLHAARSAAVHYGITATTPQMPAAVKIAAAIRAVRPEATVILGGPHVTLVNAAAKRERRDGVDGRAAKALRVLHAAFDVLVAGDGEEAILLALRKSPPPLVDADEPKSPLFLTNAALTAMPFAARHLVDVDSYHYYIDGRRALSLIARLAVPSNADSAAGARRRPGSPRILQNINKRSTRDENTRCLEIANRAGLKVKALMSIGHPGESPETVRDTYEWLVETRPADFDVTIITTYPGTPYYDEAVPHDRLPDVWTYTYKKTGDRVHAYEVDYTRVAEYSKETPTAGTTRMCSRIS